MQDRIYRVYISSTAAPATSEHTAILHGVLASHSMPVCPALWDLGQEGQSIPTNDNGDDWVRRKALINSCDYVLFAGNACYGERSSTGVSIQHQELTYALMRDKPVFCVLLAEETLSQSGASTEELGRVRALRALLKRHNPVFWRQLETLPETIISGFPAFVADHPGTGWSKTKPQITINTAIARETVNNLTIKPQATCEAATALSDNERVSCENFDWLQQHQEFSVQCHVFIHGNCHRVEQNVSLSWADVYEAFRLSLNPSCNEDRIQQSLSVMLEARFSQQILRQYAQAHAADAFRFSETAMRMIRLKLRRHGLVRKDTRASSRKNNVWCLTRAGKAAGHWIGRTSAG
ncbi:MAG: hypothetical protein B0D91_12315 [Oceanospirillales bacterium LUC14_002_19_P2]|nr:MAG: hypothetical protein B0D91_12315 [Oceanospirillales bacterium LUC14_002_19_P2]